MPCAQHCVYGFTNAGMTMRTKLSRIQSELALGINKKRPISGKVRPTGEQQY